MKLLLIAAMSIVLASCMTVPKQVAVAAPVEAIKCDTVADIVPAGLEWKFVEPKGMDEKKWLSLVLKYFPSAVDTMPPIWDEIKIADTKGDVILMVMMFEGCVEMINAFNKEQFIWAYNMATKESI